MMFTGLIETTGRIALRSSRGEGMAFRIECHFESGDYEMGESIAVDGVCVTVEKYDGGGFNFSVSAETMQRSTLRIANVGDRVHLERALRLGDRLGGHLVQGHVDGIGEVVSITRKETGAELIITVPDALIRYVVEKGSLSVQGVSLTVASMERGRATVALIPATLESTCLGNLKLGGKVNLEVDILAKYVESMLANRESGIDESKLRAWGFE
jgi:riboflavin synthase